MKKMYCMYIHTYISGMVAEIQLLQFISENPR